MHLSSSAVCKSLSSSTLFLFILSPAPSLSEMPPVVAVSSTGGVTPVAVVSVSAVPASVTTVQTMALLPQPLSAAALPHAMPQPTAAMPAFPPVMVPPFRVPLPGMHLPPGAVPQPRLLHGSYTLITH